MSETTSFPQVCTSLRRVVDILLDALQSIGVGHPVFELVFRPIFQVLHDIFCGVKLVQLVFDSVFGTVNNSCSKQKGAARKDRRSAKLRERVPQAYEVPLGSSLTTQRHGPTLVSTISTLRFFCRPSGLSEPSGFLLGATGLVSPQPRVLIRAGWMPEFFTSQFFTESCPVVRKLHVVIMETLAVGVSFDPHG